MSYTKIGTEWRGYYITAYGIAVKHGFTGTEEELSLIHISEPTRPY